MWRMGGRPKPILVMRWTGRLLTQVPQMHTHSALVGLWGLSLCSSTIEPVFLIDMLPQGFGRQELLQRIGLSPMAGVPADWHLLMAGAGNPIGHLRIKEAAQWVDAHAGATRGFTDQEVAQRGDEFSEYLASYGLFVAGSSGVQGSGPRCC